MARTSGGIGSAIVSGVLLAVVVGALVELWRVTPEGWPIFARLAPPFRALPVPAAVAIGVAFGVAAIVIGAMVSRIHPFPWGVVAVCLGLVILAIFTAGMSLGVLTEPFGDIPILVPVAGALLPMGLGLFGLQRMVTRNTREGRLPGLLLAIAGLYCSLQILRSADVQPPPAAVSPEVPR